MTAEADTTVEEGEFASPDAAEDWMRQHAVAMPEGYTGIVMAVTGWGPTFAVVGPDLPAMLWVDDRGQWCRAVTLGVGPVS